VNSTNNAYGNKAKATKQKGAKMTQKLKQLAAYISIAVLGLSLTPVPVSAAQITTRSMTLIAGATDGGSMPGGVVNHQLDFTVNTTGNVGSIKFEYCTLAATTCVTPSGLSTTSAALGAQSGATGFTIVNTTNGAPYITRSTSSITAPQALSYRLDSITNPTDANKTFYVRITTYASTDTTGSVTDAGVVAASTANQIIITGTMPESLVFCTGATISTTGGVPDCTTATAGSIAFDRLFSPTDTATTTSQMAASTNAGSGYNITVNGTTLTSGANTIAAMSSAGIGIRNSSQFGMNLKANTTATSTPAVGTEVAPASNTTNYRGQSLAGYNTVDTFKYATGDSVANSGNAVLGPTDQQIYTVSYIVNVPGSQPAGTYTTTLTYICTATF
jgi:hypothetical protein